MLFSYRGTNFLGWQRQKRGRTVQGEIERALSSLFQREIPVFASGRTDRGAHALGQTAHFEIPEAGLKNRGGLIKALNHKTPPDISFMRAQRAPDSFHARFSAEKKTYFILVSRLKPPQALIRDFVWGLDPLSLDPLSLDPLRPDAGAGVPRAVPCGDAFAAGGAETVQTGAVQTGTAVAGGAGAFLDIRKLNFMSKILIGEHDFKSFQNSGSTVSSTVRSVFEAGWREISPSLWIFQITANGFLRQMARNTAGAQAEILRKNLPLETFQKILESRDRSFFSFPPAPACGLYLKEVVYPPAVEKLCHAL